MLDSHIHIMNMNPPQPDRLEHVFSQLGLTGGVLISAPPACFTREKAGPSDVQDRLDLVLAWCNGRPDWFPFFWIDPLDASAADQVAVAVAAGIAGFKIICNQAEPDHPAVLDTARRIAAAGRPLLFHSGILWDGQDSSRFNRPAGFEALLHIPKLRFALAHASWPWIDECLAVFGKFQQARRQAPQACAEMFIDLTPGTPRLYRDELYRKLLGIGYPLLDHILFGTDGLADTYEPQWAADWLALDQKLLEQHWQNGVQPGYASPADAWLALTEKNLRRFIARS